MRPSSRILVPVAAAAAALLVPAAALAEPFTEQDAQARWQIDFKCPDGSKASDGRLFLETDNFRPAGKPRDPSPPLRVGFTGQCPDGTFSWGFFHAAPTQWAPDVRRVAVNTTTGTATDNRGITHTISVRALWTGTGPAQSSTGGPGSGFTTKQRAATATTTILFDGKTLVNGPSNFPFPAPFIRKDTQV